MSNRNFEITSTILAATASIIVAIFVVKVFPYPRPVTTPPIINPVVDSNALKNEVEKEMEPIEFTQYLSSLKISIYPVGLVTPESLVDACEDKKKIQDVCNKQIAGITRIFETIQSPNKGFLYIKAGVSYSGEPIHPLTDYDSLWLFMDESQYSGHILRNAVVVNRRSVDGYSELLVDLSRVPLTQLPYNPNAEPSKIVDITNNVLSQEGKHYLASFVSTKGYGVISELKIGYSGGQLSITEL